MSIALEHFRAAPIHQVTLHGLPLCYRRFGAGPAVLMVHGWPLSGVTYRYLIEALSPHYTCYVPDLPGTGDTPWSPTIRETTQSYTQLLQAFVDHLQLERLALIGHDSGGGIARLLAAELGARVSCLLLQNTELPGHTPPMVRALKAASATKLLATTLSRLLKHRGYRRSALGFGGCFGDLDLIEGEFYEACLRPLTHAIAGHISMLAHLDLDWTRHLPEVHARIEAPIHLFWGGHDPFFPLALAREMAATFKRPGELAVVPGAKLYVHEEAHAQLADFCLPLLRRAFDEARAKVVA
jgi:pimeloyl-ACP methyl ester carboxylesterase